MRQQRASDADDFHRQVDDHVRAMMRDAPAEATYVPPTYQYNPHIRQRRIES